MAKKYVWLKLQKDFFQQKEIKKLRKTTSGGAVYTLIYLKMQLLSLENSGKLYFEGVEDNFIEELALELDETVEDVQMTVLFLEKHKLIEIGEVQDEYILPAVVENIGSETASAGRMRKMRAKEEAKKLSFVTANNKGVTERNNVTPQLHNSDVSLLENVTEENLIKSMDNKAECNNVTPELQVVAKSYIEKEREKEEEKEKEKEKEREEEKSFLSQLSNMEFSEKINLLRKAIMKATGKNQNQVDLVFRVPFYTDNIDNVLLAIKKSKYLRGELADRKPNLNTYTVKAQIDRIVAGAFEDYKPAKAKAETGATIGTLKHKQNTEIDDLLESMGM